MSAQRKDRLGRGLGALLGDYLEEEPQEGEVRTVSLDSLHPNPFQPRREFDPEELKDLASSIRENGLLQPLVIRPAPDARGSYQLVAGERRFRAVTELGWSEVPAVVREVDDRTLLVLALVENLQRQALSALEEAEGYRTLADSFDLTQGEIAEAVGKDRSTVANTLRLLNLPPSVRKLLEVGDLSMGHARALLSVDSAARAGELARRAAQEGWSVREVEKRVRAQKGGGEPDSGDKGKTKSAPRKDPLLRALEEELRAVLATRVKVKGSAKGKGVIEVPYHGPEDFERLFELMTGREASEVVG